MMMCSTLPVFLAALAAALAAPAAPNAFYDDYPMAVPQKRAALVLDRLLIALQKALHESPRYEQPADTPRVAALRINPDEMSDLAMAGGEAWPGVDELRVAPLSAPAHPLTDMTGLQRRGQTGGAAGVRGRVLRCYFNAITCF